jgi:hypothetical protein
MGILKYIESGVLAAVIVCGFAFKTESTIPENAIILVDMDKKVYYSPTYLRDYKISSDNLVVFTCKDISGKGYEPDDMCKDAGYFSAGDNSCFIAYKVKQLLGLMKKRGNEDGTSNW